MSELVFSSYGQEVTCQELDSEGYVVRSRPITFRNGYDLQVAADRRDLARTILTEVVGWRLANRLESAFAAEVIGKIDHPNWTVLASDVEDWMQQRERRSA